MRFFIKNNLDCSEFSNFFSPEKHPYEYHSSYPLRHGLLKNGDIDWPFWCKQETWTMDEAVRLLDDERPGYDSYYAGVWKKYWNISDGLKKILASGGGYHIFQEKPELKKAFSRGKPSEDECLFGDPSEARDYTFYVPHDTRVYPKPFVEWAYHNDYFIPVGLQGLLPKALKADNPSPFGYINVAYNKETYIEALASVRHDDWDSRRGITAQLLNDLGFTARETYLALSESGKSLDEPNGDPDAIARKWRRTGRHLMEKLDEID
jgi:hypothetical protein